MDGDLALNLDTAADPDATRPPPSALPGDVRDVSSLAHWSASSAKPGFGVENLGDDSLDTFWE
ncbi:hypothetical protein HK405_013377 [Cladochytrium tenue]|nr:hypothetical protein HK405_013377 [Cladochytrium tenue]